MLMQILPVDHFPKGGAMQMQMQTTEIQLTGAVKSRLCKTAAVYLQFHFRHQQNEQ